MILVVGAGGGGHYRRMQYLMASIIGLMGGVTSGLFGVGGGIVMVPAMMFLLNTNVKTAVGTSLVVIIPTALAGAFKHHYLGNIDWRIALAVIPLAVAGGVLGAGLTQPLPAETLKRMFGGLMIVFGVKLLFR